MNEEEEVYNGPQSFKQEPLKTPVPPYGQPQYGQQPQYGNRPQYNQQPPYGQQPQQPQQTQQPQYGNQPQYTQQPQYNPIPQYTQQPKPVPPNPLEQRAVYNQNQAVKPEKPKKKVGKIIGICSAIVVLLAGLGIGMYFLFDKKESGGASSIETIGYAYIDAFNSGNASNLKDYVSDDVKNKDEFVKNVEGFFTNHKMGIKELDKSKAEVETGDAYSKADTEAELSKWDYEKDKSDEIREATLSVKYTDPKGIENAGTYSCVFTCMRVKDKWFILSVKDIDIQPYASGSNVVVPDDLSNDLLSQQICFDGQVLQIPFDYSLISDKYSYDLSDYGYDDDYELDPGDVLPGTIALKNDDMDENTDIWIGLINDSDEKKPIGECKVESFQMDISYTDSGSYPSLILPGGITWGSTSDEIIEAYGDSPIDPYYADSLGYTEYTYASDDYSYYVELYVYDDGGLERVNITMFK